MLKDLIISSVEETAKEKVKGWLNLLSPLGLNTIAFAIDKIRPTILGSKLCHPWSLYTIATMLSLGLILTYMFYSYTKRLKIEINKIKEKPKLFKYNQYWYDESWQIYCPKHLVPFQPSRKTKWGPDHNAAFVKCPECGLEVFMENELGEPLCYNDFKKKLIEHHTKNY